MLASGNMDRSKNYHVKIQLNTDSLQQGQGPFILPLLPDCMCLATPDTRIKDTVFALKEVIAQLRQASKETISTQWMLS